LSRPSSAAADFAAHPAEHDADGAPEAREAGNGAARAEMAGESGGDGERRRRRRGRRGGRRNRRGREGEGFAPDAREDVVAGTDDGEGFAPEIAAAVEPEATRAVTDLDTAAAAAPPPAREAPAAEPQSEWPAPAAAEPRDIPPPPMPAAAAAETPAAPEAPRRRSTVREPAPQALGHEGDVATPSFTAQPMPAVEPVVSSSTEGESSDRPRRSGWWSKRVLGKG
jgi:ribonuclease E